MWIGCVYDKESPCPSICLSICLVHATPPLDKPILVIQLYTVAAVYNLSVCMKGDNHAPKHFKGDN